MPGPSPTPISPEQAVEGLFDLLDKTAAEADSLEQTVKRQAQEIAELKRQPKVASASPLDPTALLKLATTLQNEQLLPVGMDAKQACEHITRNPNTLVRWMYTLASPVRETEGRGVKSAAAPDTKLSGDVKLVKIEDRVVKDDCNWYACITP